MIYEMDDTYIDLSKLEYVSKIYKLDYKPINDDIDFAFYYTINSNASYRFSNENKNIVQTNRDNLIKAWKEYKDQK